MPHQEPAAARDLPTHEGESLSPLALGFSMMIDYQTRKLTFGSIIPVEPVDFELPLRLHRLAMVRGTVDGTRRRTSSSTRAAR